VGIEEGVSCTIKVTVDDTGAVQLLEIVKSSGIMLFDVSARAALQQATWPRAFWGTTLELCLQ
jgi:TonB family protein